MDIICLRCGKHLISIEAAREHKCHNLYYKAKPHVPPKVAPHDLVFDPSSTNTNEIPEIMTIEEFNRLWNLEKPNRAKPKVRLEHKVTGKHITSIKTPKPTPGKSARPAPTVKKDAHPKSPIKISPWIFSLMLIFVLSVIGIGLSLFLKTSIPFWILSTFSLILSIEKWLPYWTRTYKTIGKLYRLVLNLSILALLGLIIWTSIQLFSQQFIPSQLAGSLILLAEFVFFIWIWKIVSKNSWRWPSMKLTIFFLISLFVVLAFAGVKPMSTYKDTVVNKATTYWEEQRVEREEQKVIEEGRKAAEKAEMLAVGVTKDYTFYKTYTTLFNEFREQNGKHSLVFDKRLNELASQRAMEISQPGNFSHVGIMQYNLGENIAMMAYSSDSPGSLVELWASSPGHRSNMLSSSYYRTGFAKNGKYAVQVFD